VKSDRRRYHFGPFVLVPAEHVLLRDGKPLHVPRRDFDLLVMLVEHAGHLLRKEELQQRLWPETIVEEGNLTKHVSTLRKALGDGEGASTYIETVPRVGFRFTGPVTFIEDGVPAASPSPVAHPRISRVSAAMGILMLAAMLAFTVSRGSGPSMDDGARRWKAFAVLPFTALGDNDLDRLGLALTDGIITRLSGQTLLPVRPTSAVRRLVGANLPAPGEIGRTLHVDVILEGHIQREGDTVRVTAQLTDLQTGSPVWAQTFDQQTGELFRLEDAIAQRVADALRLRLAAAEQRRLQRRYTQNALAYAAYVEGRSELLRYTPEGARSAVAAFERALGFDPGYTLARAGLAMASADMYLRYAPERELSTWGDRARRDALAAVALDPDLAEAHLAHAAVSRKREFDWEATIAASQRAVILNPNLDQPRYFLAAALYHQGLMAEALSEMERGLQVGGSDRVEPLRIEGLVALFSGEFAQARQRLEEVSRQSSRAIGDTYLALAYYYSGDLARGRAMLEELVREPSAATSARSRVALAGLLAASGELQAARGLIDAVLAGGYRDHHVEYGIGAALAQLGDVRGAVEWLRRAADSGFPCVVWYERDPWLDPLRTIPAFRDLSDDLAARRDAAMARFRTSEQHNATAPTR
jgi:DNA-binding winged helix-turn-helix (wHTH) protein/TolB-like protein